MQFKVIISTGNDAFGDTHFDCGIEVARILRELAGRLEDETRLTMETIATRGPMALQCRRNEAGSWD